MGKYFGTDGIRGPVGSSLVNESFFGAIGAAVSAWMADWGDSPHDSKERRVVFGQDARPSGPALTRAFCQGMGPGIDCVDAGVLPTPALARLIGTEQADLGVMITASHNPCGDNGVKLFRKEGRKLYIEEEMALECLLDRILKKGSAPPRPPPSMKALEGGSDYIDAICRNFPKQMLKGWKVVLDTANGATRLTSPEAFRQLGGHIVSLGNSGDGSAINRECGSEFPEKLAAAVIEHGADIGFAHDGDGDRLVCVDANGELLNGDRLLGILALDGIRRGWMERGTLVTTLQSNIGLDRAVKKEGGTVVRVDVGDRWVSRKMVELDASFGGENSGHLIFRCHGLTGDGLFAALRLVEVLNRENRELSRLGREIQLAPQWTGSVPVHHKPSLEECPLISETVHQWQKRFGDEGRILLRYSGTEPLLRILTECDNVEEARAAGVALVTAVQKELG